MFGFLKALKAFTSPRSALLTSLLPRTDFNYQAQVGKGFRSSVVMAPVHWIARTFPQSRLTVEIDDEPVVDHALTQLVARPNPFYGESALWTASIFSYVLTGNAYWLVVRDERTRKPIELWYAPDWMLTPVSGESGAEFITRYDYSPRGSKIPLDVSDVIHFRYGLDPQNVTKGISPLASLWREIFTDDEAANFTAALLKNMGLAGVVISPAAGRTVSQKEIDEARREISERLTGDRRGKPLVMSAATDVKQMAFSPQQLTLGSLRDVPEERVCAVLGIPAAVVGFGTGLQQTKVGATMREYIRLAWTANLIPMGRAFASELERSLLPELESSPDRGRVLFSTAKVEALQESSVEQGERAARLFSAGIITRGEARKTTGFMAQDRDDIFLLPVAAIEVPADTPKAVDLRLSEIKAVLKGPYEPTGAITAERAKALADLGQLINGSTKQDFQAPLLPPPRRRLNQAQQRFRSRLMRDHELMSDIFAPQLEKVFSQLGRAAAASAKRVAEGKADDYLVGAADDDPIDGIKADADLLGQVDEIVAGMDIPKIQKSFIKIGEAHYLRVAEQIFEAVGSEFSITDGKADEPALSIGLPDPVAQEIIAAGGTNMGLVDLDKQTRETLLKILEAAREEGLGPPAIARRIRGKIPPGRYTSSKIRARVIARTETKNAQRESTVRAYRESGRVERVIVIDNVTGFGDPDCSFWNGREVTLAEAQQLGAQEHPNGTRDFVPIIV